MNKTIHIIVVLAFMSGGIIGGFFYGKTTGLAIGVEQGKVEVKEEQGKTAALVAQRAAKEAAKAANPFDVSNPLENINSNPFALTEDILNPFEKS